MTEKIYLETFEKCPRYTNYPLLAICVKSSVNANNAYITNSTIPHI